MSGLRIWEIILILGLVLLFFGPKRLPGLGASLGSAIRGFKRSLGGESEEDAVADKQLPAKSENPHAKA